MLPSWLAVGVKADVLYGNRSYKATITEILPRQSVVWVTYSDTSREDIAFADVEARMSREKPKKIAKRKNAAAAQASERASKKPKRAAGSVLVGRHVLTNFGVDGSFKGRIIRYEATHREGRVQKPYNVVYEDGEKTWETIDDPDVDLLPEVVGKHVCYTCACVFASGAALRVHKRLCTGPASVVQRARTAPAAKRVSPSAVKATQPGVVDSTSSDESSSASGVVDSASSDDLFSASEGSGGESDASDADTGRANAAAHERSWPSAARDTERVIASLGLSAVPVPRRAIAPAAPGGECGVFNELEDLVSFFLFTVTFHANHAHNLTRSP